MCTGETETPFPVDKGDMISVIESFFDTDVILKWVNSNYFWYGSRTKLLPYRGAFFA